MKKAFSLLAAVFLIIASGCEKQSEKKFAEAKIPESFTSIIEVSCKEIAMTAKITHTSFGNGKIKIISPEILEPLEMTFVDEKCEVVYDSLQFETDSERFPQVKIGSVLMQTLSYIGTGIDIEKTSDDSNICYSGSCEHGMFVLKQNPESENLTEFTIESMDLHIKFTEFNAE